MILWMVMNMVVTDINGDESFSINSFNGWDWFAQWVGIFLDRVTLIMNLFIGYFLLLSTAYLNVCCFTVSLRYCRRGGCDNRHVSRHVQAIGTFRPATSSTHQEFSRQPSPTNFSPDDSKYQITRQRDSRANAYLVLNHKRVLNRSFSRLTQTSWLPWTWKHSWTLPLRIPLNRRLRAL